MKLSACMIAKNEEEMLKKTLPDLVKSVDEVILVDTGSTDGTVDFAKSCGAKVYHFPWINDFSAARNESLKHATGDWTLWIDADEYIKPEDLQRLKNLLSDTPHDIFMLKICECPVFTLEPASFYFRYKVFRSGRGFHFERPINEQVFDARGKVALSKQLMDMAPIYHWGNFKAKEKMMMKKERNIAIFQNLLAKNPGDYVGHFMLAENYRELKRYDEAISEFKKALALGPNKKVAINALTNLAWCYYKLKNGLEAYQTAMEALKLDENNPSACNVVGSIFLSTKRIDQAIQIFEHSRQLPLPEGDQGFVSIEQREYVANFLLGNAYLRKGDEEKAREAFLLASRCRQTKEVSEKLRELQWV